MFEAIDQIKNFLPAYMLIFTRLSALLLSMPIFSYAQIPARVRIGLTFMLTIIIGPLVIDTFSFQIDTVPVLLIYMLREVFLGLIIGFGARLVFEGFSMAGAFIGMQMGMAIMNVFDPTHEENQPIISNFWLFVVMIFFLVTNSHHFLIQTLFQNFKMIKLGTATLHAGVGQTMVDGGTIMFELALKFAAPSMIFLLSVDVAIAYMARVMPQLNIFFISLPLKIGVGIILLIVSLRIFQGLFGYIVQEMEGFVLTIIHGF